jgi:hypothetical protein
MKVLGQRYFLCSVDIELNYRRQSSAQMVENQLYGAERESSSELLIFSFDFSSPVFMQSKALTILACNGL